MRRFLPALLVLVGGCLANGEAQTSGPASGRQTMIEMNAAQLARALNETGTVVLTTLQFAPDSATIERSSHATLALVADVLKNDQDLTLEIQGHTEETGPTSQALSEARAEAVRDYLVTNFGVSADRLTAVGYGATRPLPGAARNARIELVKPGAASLPSAPRAPSADGPGEWTGRIAAGMMAIGGETTGISLVVSESGERFELQGADAAMRQRLRDLDGETVTIRGTLETRPGVEIRTRRIITVTDIVQ